LLLLLLFPRPPPPRRAEELLLLLLLLLLAGPYIFISSRRRDQHKHTMCNSRDSFYSGQISSYFVFLSGDCQDLEIVLPFVPNGAKQTTDTNVMPDTSLCADEFKTFLRLFCAVSPHEFRDTLKQRQQIRHIPNK
jgi:hypothetical protein